MANTRRTPAKKAVARKAPARKAAAGRQAAKGIASDVGEFRFDHDGITYTLPPASKYANVVSGGELMDAFFDNSDTAEFRMVMTALKAAAPDAPEAYAALRSMSAPEFLETVQEWFSWSGATMGESARSST